MAAVAVAAISSVDAFLPAPMLPAARASRRAMPLSGATMVAAATRVEKPGTGENRMTSTGFSKPLVERVELPGTSQGFEYRIRSDLDLKKLNMQEKVKVEKPGLAVLDELQALAAEAKAKGGAQHCDDQPSINLRLKWLGLFHRDKHMPGGFMWRMRCPNGSFSINQALFLKHPLCTVFMHLI